MLRNRPPSHISTLAETIFSPTFPFLFTCILLVLPNCISSSLLTTSSLIYRNKASLFTYSSSSILTSTNHHAAPHSHRRPLRRPHSLPKPLSNRGSSLLRRMFLLQCLTYSYTLMHGPFADEKVANMYQQHVGQGRKLGMPQDRLHLPLQEHELWLWRSRLLHPRVRG